MNVGFICKFILLLLALSVLSVCTGYFISESASLAFVVLLIAGWALVFLWTVIRLKRFLTSINYYLESIRNNDFSFVSNSSKNLFFIPSLRKNVLELKNFVLNIQTESKKQEQYLSALIEHVGIGILSYRKSGHVIHANSAIRKLLGIEVLTHVKQLNRVAEGLMEEVKTIEPGGKKIIKTKGDLSLLVRKTSLSHADDTITILSMQDIHQELDENEIESWMKLIRVLTHEIMNSIAPIHSLSESLSSYFNENSHEKTLSNKQIENTQRGLNVIKEQSLGLMSFVETYRSFTHIPKPSLIEKPLVPIIEQVVHLFNSDVINIETTNTELKAQVDETQLTLVLTNLLKNALEATQGTHNGRINIFLKELEKKEVLIQIKDNGVGIEPDVLKEIFIPFFTTKEKGSGIGLSISKQIIRMHGGRIYMHSEQGKGAVASIVLKS